jgi:hypothetical protein
MRHDRCFMGLFTSTALIVVFLACVPSVAFSDTTIVSVSGTPLFDNNVSHFGEIYDWPYSTSWTQSQPYADVTISTVLKPGGPISAFLTTSLGPATDATSQIAVGGFGLPPTGSDYPLLSGLTLPPGTYYLTLWSPPYGAESTLWALLPPDSASIVTDTGAIVNASESARPVDYPAYPPSGTFHPLSSDFLFSVTGTPVPEPTTLGIAGILLLLARRRVVRSHAGDRTKSESLAVCRLLVRRR